MVLSRRAVVVLGSTIALAGCGFQPVYMPTASRQAGPAERELAAINVGLIPDRPGMLMRQALQDRLEGSGDGTPRRYDLTVSFGVNGAGLGMQPDTTITRIRLTGIADWTLLANDPTHTRLTSGHVRAVDALNTLDSQVFATDLEIEAIQKRLAEALADQITLQLAAFFRQRAAATPAS
jgi:LPS-assembly lipoprotein